MGDNKELALRIYNSIQERGTCKNYAIDKKKIKPIRLDFSLCEDRVGLKQV